MRAPELSFFCQMTYGKRLQAERYGEIWAISPEGIGGEMFKGILFLTFSGAALCTVLFVMFLPWIGTLSLIGRALVLLPPFCVAAIMLVHLLLREMRNPTDA